MTSFPALNITADGFAPDPCTLTDEERDVLQRRKRKNDAYKTALCESFRRTDTCSYGEECRFAHGMDELRLPAQPRGRSHPKYKTVLCDKFSATGYCKYGARCQFIHRITNAVLLRDREDAWKLMSCTARRGGNMSLFEDPHNMPVSPFIKPGHFDLNASLPASPSFQRRFNSSRLDHTYDPRAD